MSRSELVTEAERIDVPPFVELNQQCLCWKWTTTIPDKSTSCTISSFETCWELKISRQTASQFIGQHIYSNSGFSFGGMPSLGGQTSSVSNHHKNQGDLDIKLCFLKGAEKAEISYKLTVETGKEANTDAATSGDVVESNEVVVFSGIKTFKQNEFTSLELSSSKNLNVPVGVNIKVTLFLTSINVDNVIKIPPNSFYSDIISAVENNKDITLMVGQDDDREEIKANKFMLIARSPVFARMFQADMKEKSTNVVKIPNINPGLFKVVLSYIHTGQVSKDLCLEETISMMDIACQYELNHLKALCENRLAIYLDTKNAAHILLEAEKYSCSELKREAIEFFANNSKAVMESEGWKDVEDSNLLKDILASVVISPSKRR